ncbi:MAG: portal protein, partial [Vampirovibrionia bacterium]
KIKEEIELPVFNEEGIQIDTKLELQEVEKIIYDGPDFQVINMFDIVFDSSLTSWQDGLVIHKTFRTIEEIKNNPVYKNIDDLIVFNTLNKEYTSLQTIDIFDYTDDSSNKENMVKLYSAYGDFKIGDKIYYDYIAVIANDKHLIRFEPNPYKEKPFVFCIYESIPNELYGLGAIEPALGIQQMVNTFSNQKADVLSLIINGMWVYVDDGIIDPEEIIAQPGALIPTKNVNNIQSIHPDNSVIMTYSEIAQLKSEFQEVTGATKYFTGSPIIDFEKTATEVSALKSAGVVRFSEVIQNIEENALKRSINLIFNYNSNFNNGYSNIKTNDRGISNVVQFSSNMLIDDFKFRIIGANSSISRDIRINKLIEFIGIASSIPVLSQYVNIIELIKRLYTELGFKDNDVIFNG